MVETNTEDSREVRMRYIDYSGQTSERVIKPTSLYWGTTVYHPEPGWLLRAWDYEENTVRDFALKDCVFNTLADQVFEAWVDVAQNSSFESGVCCCGEYMENHSDPMICGHVATDSAGYVVHNLVRTTLRLLGRTSPKSDLDS